MAHYDRDELQAITVVRLKARRCQLRRSKQLLKEGVAVVTPSVQQQLDDLNKQIRDICERIYRLTGERE